MAPKCELVRTSTSIDKSIPCSETHASMISRTPGLHRESTNTKGSPRKHLADTRQAVPDDRRLLAKGPKAGHRALQPDTKPVASIANLGLARGGKATGSADPTFVLEPVAIRVLAWVQPLLFHDSVAAALRELRMGGDLQQAQRVLGHDDATTVRALLRAWFDRWGMAPPLTCLDPTESDPSVLSRAARDRVGLSPSTLIAVPFVVESCGCDSTTEEQPLLPLDWLGRRFASGADFRNALQRLLQPDANPTDDEGSHRMDLLVSCATYSALVAIDEEWVDQGALQRMLEARGHRPTGMVRLLETVPVSCHAGEADPARQLRVDFVPFPSPQPSDSTAPEHLPHTVFNTERSTAGTDALLYRLVSGRGPLIAGDVGSTSSSPKPPPLNPGLLVLAVPTSILNREASGLRVGDGDVTREVSNDLSSGFRPRESGADAPLRGSRCESISTTSGTSSKKTRQVEASRGLMSPTTRAARDLLVPGSQLQKAIRRGLGLCSHIPLLEAALHLVTPVVTPLSACPLAEAHHARCSGTRTFLWRVFLAAFEDSGPYLPESGDEDPETASLSLPVLLALLLIAHVDASWRMPRWVCESALRTALFLQAHDGAEVHWPWRGWRFLTASPADTAKLEGTQARDAQLRDSLRCALTTIPMSKNSALVLARFLGALSTTTWCCKLATFPEYATYLQPEAKLALSSFVLSYSNCTAASNSSDQSQPSGDCILEADPQKVQLDQEVRLAAMDQTVKPNMLLFLQAGMPFPPSEASQHTLQALAELAWRISSSVNARTIRQQAGGQAPAEELFRMQTFLGTSKQVQEATVGADTVSENSQTQGERRALQSERDSWRSVEDAQTLTPHESVLLKVLQSVQRHMYQPHLLDDPDQLDGIPEIDGEDEKVLRPEVEAPARIISTRSRSRGAGFVKSDAGHTSEQREEEDKPSRATRGSSTPAVHQDIAKPQISEITHQGSGRAPTAYEARTAFLQLFGGRELFQIPQKKEDGSEVMTTVSVTVAGTAEQPVLVQVVGDTAGDSGCKPGAEPSMKDNNADEAFSSSSSSVGSLARYQYILEGPLYAASLEHLLARFVEGQAVLPPSPPPGFVWRWGSKSAMRICIQRETARALKRKRDSAKAWKEDGATRLCFFVDGVEVPAFDATIILQPCNQPNKVGNLNKVCELLVEEALYAQKQLSMEGAEHAMELLARLDRAAARARLDGARSLHAHGEVVDWHDIALRSRLSRHVWRDVFVKLLTREGDVVEVAPLGRDARRAHQAVQQLSEGSVLRVLYALQVLYPLCLCREGELRFRVQVDGVQFVHMWRMLRQLAFGSCVSKGVAEGGETATPERGLRRARQQSSATDPEKPLPTVVTSLWDHQIEAVERVMAGVEAGKRGFADASAVGAGKTLTAIATLARVAAWSHRLGIKRHGFVVLLPNNALIAEWCEQVLMHTSGFKVLVQQQSGQLKTRGVSCAAAQDRNEPSPPQLGNADTSTSARGGGSSKPRATEICQNTIVVTTLGRCRDKPFTGQAGWDMVVIDECLSVQNDGAMHTMEAWRQVAASRWGVMMLSATFFRSRFSKLFYMVRMLRSALPRTEAFLSTTLHEHVIRYIPANRRSWELVFREVALPPKAHEAYQARLQDFVRKSAVGQARDYRVLYTELKAFLRNHYETTTLVDAFKAEVAKLQTEGRRPLLFANSDQEASRLLHAIPNARRLVTGGGRKAKGKGPLVLTVHKGAHGLNLQGEADAIICRPQAGDVVEQMKGRVDRPGQVSSHLVMVVLYAAGTVEEAEASNIRLCGTFFRHFLDPLSRVFQERAAEAMISVATATTTPEGERDGRVSTPVKTKGHACKGYVAAAYQRQLAARQADWRSAASHSPSQVTKPRTQSPDHATPTKSPKTTPKPASVKILQLGQDQLVGEGSHEEASPSASKRQKWAADSASGSANTHRGKRKHPGSPETPKSKVKSSEAAERSRKASAKSPQAKMRALEPIPGAPRTITLDVVPIALQHLSSVDPKLGQVIRQIGPPTQLLKRQESSKGDPFKQLSKSVVYQQLSTKAAATIFGRLITLCGGEEEYTPASLLAQEVDDLRKAGLSARKVEYLQGIAEAFQKGTLDPTHWDSLEDWELMEKLVSLRGLGEWSVHMFMMFHLNRADILPVGDLAVRKAFRRLYGVNDGVAAQSQTAISEHVDLPGRSELERIAAAWRPYRTIGSWYMWHVLETKEAAYTFGAPV